ncbi:AraC family transcriptional regulator [Vibrio sp. 10N.261.55.A7]|uniref:AraC family transcriptional regulator n=1 Tax=Vibrio sp. 10N.261.55.A7 TaxID=1880851 RepID=UPI000C868191|nr:AraC family transcriptional regulator [Vibrio sp. 10N.261.55.A7]PMJ91718.1 AraC family transcriptional regulator [Vibrio sp. 10N.261.55.A7]
MSAHEFKIPVIQTNYARVLVQVCSDFGLDLHKLLEESGLPADLMQSESEFVPSESIKRLIFLSSTQLGVSSFVDILKLAIGQRILPVILHQFTRYPTIGDALADVQQIFRNDTPSSNVFFVQEHGHHWFCVDSLGEENPYYQWSEAFAIVYITQLMTALLNEDWQPSSVKVKSRDIDIVKQVIPRRCRLFVENEYTGVQIPSELLSLPIALSAKALSEKPALVEWHTSFTDTVFEVLKPYVRERDLTIEYAAELLSFSVRTLQRKLTKERTSFRKIRDNLVFSVACELIEEGHSLTYVANQLGYSDLPHFSRAFKRVSGLTPNVYKLTVG